MPPSVLISDGDGTWTRKDRLIAVALTLHEASVCSGCGSLIGDTWDTGADISVQEHTCAGCKAREEHVKNKSDGLGPGVKVGIARADPADYDPNDEVLPVYD